jgi:diacylglycerol kinase family enzyme
VAVFCNDNAGAGASPGDIHDAIARHGHSVVQLLEKDQGLERLFDRPCDLVVAAGGDGTVASVAREVAGRRVPMAMLPLGTANNLARSFGWTGTFDEIIDGWRLDRAGDADLGLARGRFGTRRFLESVGGGIVTRVIADMDEHPTVDEMSPGTQFAMAIDRYSRVMASLVARPWTFRIDGADVEGQFLLVEVMNARSIGPNFEAVADSDPCDGFFTVAIAREAHREVLSGYWSARRHADAPAPPALERILARDVEIIATEEIHVDDEVFTRDEAGGVSLAVEQGAFRVLLGPAPTRRPGPASSQSLRLAR